MAPHTNSCKVDQVGVVAVKLVRGKVDSGADAADQWTRRTRSQKGTS